MTGGLKEKNKAHDFLVYQVEIKICVVLEMIMLDSGQYNISVINISVKIFLSCTDNSIWCMCLCVGQ